jgi:hypothetical protein
VASFDHRLQRDQAVTRTGDGSLVSSRAAFFILGHPLHILLECPLVGLVLRTGRFRGTEELTGRSRRKSDPTEEKLGNRYETDWI